jgi:hypothetical protein
MHMGRRGEYFHWADQMKHHIVLITVSNELVRGFNLPAQQAVDAVRIADLGS